MKFTYNKGDIRKYIKRLNISFGILLLFSTIVIILLLFFINKQNDTIVDLRSLVNSTANKYTKEKYSEISDVERELNATYEPIVKALIQWGDIVQEKEYLGTKYYAYAQERGNLNTLKYGLKEEDIPENIVKILDEEEYYYPSFTRVYFLGYFDNSEVFIPLLVSSYGSDLSYEGLFDIFDEKLYVTNYFSQSLDIYEILPEAEGQYGPKVKYFDSITFPFLWSDFSGNAEFCDISCDLKDVCQISFGIAYYCDPTTFEVNTKTNKVSNIEVGECD